MVSLLSSATFPSTYVDSRTACCPGLQNAQVHVCALRFLHCRGVDGAASNQERFLASAYKQRRSDKLPPGAYEMVNEETGRCVLVLGIEGEEDNVPSDEMLEWEHVKYAKRGDISDQAWLRMLEASPPTGGAVYSSDDSSIGSKSKIKEAARKKVYPDASTLKGKGLFSKLKVQTLRSQKGSAKLQNGRVSMQKDIETSSLPRKTDEGSSRQSGSNFAQRLEDTETRHPLRKTVKEGSSRREVAEAGSIRAEMNLKGSLAQNAGTRSTRASQVQKCSKVVVDKDFFSIKSFKSLGVNEKVLQALEFMEMRHPSQIQALSYEHVLNGRSCIIADQTGSGKTLAYLAPLFHRFLEEEENGLSKSLPNRPRGLVVVPTSELASQVLNVCRLLSKGGAPLRSMVATGGFRLKTQVEALENCADMVIATPGRFLQLLNVGSLGLDNLKSVVLDEVDVLFDDPEFSETLERIESLVSLKTQYIHVTATLPVDICDNILEKHPNSMPLMGPGLHCTAAGLQEVLVDCSGEGEKNPETAYENKKKALRQLVEQQPVSKTIIFCNKIETCRKVENVLKRSDRKGSSLMILPYHAALSQEVRLENMQKFMETDSDKSVFLVCTDRASRGLDLVDVEHVVLFDFPRDPSEYVRRVGRTARAGGAGKAFVFVVGKQVPLARRIMLRNEKGHPIHSVPSHSY